MKELIITKMTEVRMLPKSTKEKITIDKGAIHLIGVGYTYLCSFKELYIPSTIESSISGLCLADGIIKYDEDLALTNPDLKRALSVVLDTKYHGRILEIEEELRSIALPQFCIQKWNNGEIIYETPGRYSFWSFYHSFYRD